jgi:hypothetical protein
MFLLFINQLSAINLSRLLAHPNIYLQARNSKVESINNNKLCQTSFIKNGRWKQIQRPLKINRSQINYFLPHLYL